MSEQEYRHLAERILKAIREQGAPRPPRATVDYLVESVREDRELVRAAMSDLIVRGELQVTSDLQVTAPTAQ
jgi:hypothetical protein